MIRIPSELIPPAPPTSAGKDVDEPPGVEQVGAAAASGNALSGEPSASRPASYQDVVRARSENAAGDSADGRATPPPAAEMDAAAPPPAAAPFPYERRQGDRRQQNRPVLLDTRVSRGRRQASGDGGINIKV